MQKTTDELNQSRHLKVLNRRVRKWACMVRLATLAVMQHESTAHVNMCLLWPLWTKWDEILLRQQISEMWMRNERTLEIWDGTDITWHWSDLYKGNSDVWATHHHHQLRVNYGEGNRSHIFVRHLIQTDRQAGRFHSCRNQMPIREPWLSSDSHWSEIRSSYTHNITRANPKTDPRSGPTKQTLTSFIYVFLLLGDTAEAAAVVMLHLSRILHINEDHAQHKREEILTRVSAPESLTSPAGLSWLC